MLKKLRDKLQHIATFAKNEAGKSLFGGDTPVINDDETGFGVNISLEIEFRHIF